MRANQNGAVFYALASTVYNGRLFIGTNDSARVYALDENHNLQYAGQLGSQSKIFTITTYRGRLYAAALGSNPLAHVYRYEGGETWTDVSPNIDFIDVPYLKEYDGRLCAGTALGAVYCYDGLAWENTGRLDFGGEADSRGSDIDYLGVYNGSLFAGTNVSGRIYRYDNHTWAYAGKAGPFDVSAFAVYDGVLYAGTNLDNSVYRYWGGTSWTPAGRLGEGHYVNSLVVFDGRLYGGTDADNGSVYIYAGGLNWNSTGRLGSYSPEAPDDVAWVYTLTVFNGRLYGGSKDGYLYYYEPE